ncbi:MAG TPA: 50S ribosomal protein L15 [Thermoanaerobaculia bacterium]
MVDKKTTKKSGGAKKSAAPGKAKKATKAAPKKAASAPAAPPAPAPKKPKPARPVRKEAAAPAVGRPAPYGVHGLAPAPGATHYRKRVGRGPGSGHGKTAGKGNKGQKSRTGYRHLRGFEGGQMPLHRRIPKRGFTNIFRVEYDVVNLSDLDRFEAGQAVNPDTLAAARLSRRNRPVKILGDGQVGKALTVSAHKFSAGAQAKIEAAGGRCEVIPR